MSFIMNDSEWMNEWMNETHHEFDSELDQNLSGDLRKIFSSDLNEIWYVGRGRWVMHDGMPYGRYVIEGV